MHLKRRRSPARERELTRIFVVAITYDLKDYVYLFFFLDGRRKRGEMRLSLWRPLAVFREQPFLTQARVSTQCVCVASYRVRL